MNKVLKKKGMIAIIAVTIIAVGFFIYRSLGSTEEITYTTSPVERGMIVSSISASGQVATSSKYSVTTSATGVIKKIYIQEGDVVKEGDTILSLKLDRNGKVNKSKAWASYLSAKSALEDARKTDLTKDRDILAAQIDLITTKQTKLSSQRELTLAKSSLIAAEDAFNVVKSKPTTNTERQQKELALQAAQHSLELAQSKYDNADKNNEVTTEQSNLLLKKELVSARMSRDVAQASYDAAMEDSRTTQADMKQKEASLLAAQQAVELAQYKYDTTDDTNKLTAEQTKLSLQKELDSANASLDAAQDAWNTIRNKPESDAERRQSELALQAATDAVDLAQQKYNLVDDNIRKANLGVSIAKQTTTKSSSAIAKAKADLDTALMFYQDTLSTVTAPVGGRITDLNLYVGMVISGSSSSSGGGSSSSGSSGGSSSGSSSSSSSSSSGQSIATIAVDNRPMVTVNVSEVDIVKVKPGQKASVTVDAISDKTFTGKVISINRSGSTSSGVTVYPTNVMLDTEIEGLQPNMAATASVITETKDNVLLIPTSVAKTSNNQTTVTILKNKQPQQVTVELGLYSDTQVEVVSGLSAGDEVVTSSTQQTAAASSQSSGSSPFAGGMGGAPGMGAMGGGSRPSGTGR